MLAEVIFLLFTFFIWRKKKSASDSQRPDSYFTLLSVYRNIIQETVNTLLLAFPFRFFFYSELHDLIKNSTVLARTQKT